MFKFNSNEGWDGTSACKTDQLGELEKVSPTVYSPVLDYVYTFVSPTVHSYRPVLLFFNLVLFVI